MKAPVTGGCEAKEEEIRLFFLLKLDFSALLRASRSCRYQEMQPIAAQHDLLM